MLRLILLVSLLSCSLNLLSQESSIKAFSNFLFLSNQDPQPLDTIDSKYAFTGFSLAFQRINKKEFFHQFEAKYLFKNEEGFERSYSHIRYEYGKHYKNLIFKTIDFEISGAARLYSLMQNADAGNFGEFPQEHLDVGVNFGLFTNFQIDLTRNLYIDIGLSVFGFNFGFDKQKILNPALTERQQDIGGFDFDIIQENVLRFGLAYKFPKKKDANSDDTL